MTVFEERLLKALDDIGAELASIEETLEMLRTALWSLTRGRLGEPTSDEAGVLNPCAQSAPAEG
jgi:hypothetical protein